MRLQCGCGAVAVSDLAVAVRLRSQTLRLRCGCGFKPENTCGCGAVAVQVLRLRCGCGHNLWDRAGLWNTDLNRSGNQWGILPFLNGLLHLSKPEYMVPPHCNKYQQNQSITPEAGMGLGFVEGPLCFSSYIIRGISCIK